MLNYQYTNRFIKHLSFTIILVCGTFSYAQKQVKNNFTDAEIKRFIIEVFQDKADVLVFKPNSKRLELINLFFKHQFSIAYAPEHSKKKYKLISSLAMNTKYNSSLTADVHYDPKKFNPLKYKFPLSTHTKKMYRIAQTDYIISINTLN